MNDHVTAMTKCGGKHSDAAAIRKPRAMRARATLLALASALGALGGSSAFAQVASTATSYQPAEWARIVAAAKKEGRVTFYSAPPPAITQLLVDGFKAAYPEISVEFARLASGEAMAKLGQERAGKLDGADLWLGTEVSWFTDRAKEGALIKIAGPASVTWPSRYLREGMVVIAGVEPMVIPYNKKLVPVPPKGYLDLLKPEFKGRMGTSELAATNVVAFYDWLEKTQGADYLTRLKAQNPRLYAGSVPTGQAVASGEIVLSAHGIPTATKPLMQQGAPIDYVVTNPAFGFEYALGVLGWSRRPNAALLFADHLMSLQTQTAWHSRGEGASPLPGIKGSLDVSTISAYDAAAYPADVVNRFRERWTKIFK